MESHSTPWLVYWANLWNQDLILNCLPAHCGPEGVEAFAQAALSPCVRATGVRLMLPAAISTAVSQRVLPFRGHRYCTGHRSVARRSTSAPPEAFQKMEIKSNLKWLPSQRKIMVQQWLNAQLSEVPKSLTWLTCCWFFSSWFDSFPADYYWLLVMSHHSSVQKYLCCFCGLILDGFLPLCFQLIPKTKAC